MKSYTVKVVQYWEVLAESRKDAVAMVRDGGYELGKNYLLEDEVEVVAEDEIEEVE